MNRPGPDPPTMQAHLLNEQSWESGWEGHELAQLRRMAALPLAQKIQWLQDAQRLANYLAAPRPAPPQPHSDKSKPNREK